MGAPLVVGALLSISCARDEPSPIPAGTGGFVEIAEPMGLEVTTWAGGRDKDHILESVGTGVAFVDYDADGWLDLYVVNAWRLDESPSGVAIRGENRLFRNWEGHLFEDVTAEAGVGDDLWGAGVCAGDYDGDGHVDLYVTNFGPNRLYRNRGDGSFEERAAGAGVDEPGWGAGASFFDADGDGDLDLYVANYIDCSEDDVHGAERTGRWKGKVDVMIGPFGLRGGRDRFFRNEGDGSFTDATDESGFTDDAEAYGLGVLTSDLDADGDVDVYVANDSNQNFLYRNDGSGHFADVGAWSGAGFSDHGSAQAGMGVDAGDVDGDGLQEIFVTNFAFDHSTLYHNAGGLFFQDVTAGHDIDRVSYRPLSWGCAFFDYDNDADLDLLIINGHIFPQVDDVAELDETYAQAPLLFRNDAGAFVDASDVPGLGLPISGRGLAMGDYDNDGDVDAVVTGMDCRPLLFRNDASGSGRWLVLDLVDARGSAAIGALATLHAAGRQQVREVRSGSTYQSQSSFRLHFGLGDCAVVDSVRVRWPDGASTLHTDLETNRRHRWVAP